MKIDKMIGLIQLKLGTIKKIYLTTISKWAKLYNKKHPEAEKIIADVDEMQKILDRIHKKAGIRGIKRKDIKDIIHDIENSELDTVLEQVEEEDKPKKYRIIHIIKTRRCIDENGELHTDEYSSDELQEEKISSIDSLIPIDTSKMKQSKLSFDL